MSNTVEKKKQSLFLLLFAFLFFKLEIKSLKANKTYL